MTNYRKRKITRANSNFNHARKRKIERSSKEWKLKNKTLWPLLNSSKPRFDVRQIIIFDFSARDSESIFSEEYLDINAL